MSHNVCTNNSLNELHHTKFTPISTTQSTHHTRYILMSHNVCTNDSLNELHHTKFTPISTAQGTHHTRYILMSHNVCTNNSQYTAIHHTRYILMSLVCVYCELFVHTMYAQITHNIQQYISRYTWHDTTICMTRNFIHISDTYICTQLYSTFCIVSKHTVRLDTLRRGNLVTPF